MDGRPARLLEGQTKEGVNELFWSDGAGGASFWLSAPFLEADLVRVAESVEAQEAPK